MSAQQGPLFVYGNWAAYDELSDGIELTEELAMRQLSELLRLRKGGVRFDAYLMDAFWFAPDGGYREWRRPHWPDGPDRWLDACRENGLLPGMWFTANTLCHLEPAPAWRDSVDDKGWGMCLFEGGFLADFLDVLDHWYQRGVRIFKFDFAEFGAVPAGWTGNLSSAEIRARNIAAFRSALLGFRSAHPEAILLGYNGFQERECMDRTDRPFARFIDPAWLDVFDSLYCGDPRPADVPTIEQCRSVDIYSDHMTRAFEASGIPLARIENCGFMAGNTGTCYWREKEGWQTMLMLSLARGGRIHVAYGDLALFSDEDAARWGRIQYYLLGFMRPGGAQSFGGVPGQGEPYGWLSPGAPLSMAMVVNPAMQPAILKLPSAGQWSVIAHDPGFVPRFSRQSVELAGNQVALIQNFPYMGVWPTDSIIVNDGGLRPEPVQAMEKGENWRTIRVGASRDYRALIVRQFDKDGFAVRTYPTKEQPLAFHVTCSLGRQEMGGNTKRAIWSGMSWAWVPLVMWDAPYEVRIEAVSSTPVTIEVEMYRSV